MEKEREEKVRALEEKVRALEEGMAEFLKEFKVLELWKGKIMDLEEMMESGTPEERVRAAVLERYIKKVLEEAKAEEAKDEEAKAEKAKGQILKNRCKEMMKASLPETFKIGRQGFFRLRRDGYIFGMDKKKLTKAKITEVDLIAFNAAICKALSNQSYISGNQDTHSGTARIDVKKTTEFQRKEAEQKAEQETNPKKRKALEEAATHIVAYTGEVVVSLPELCKDGYGDTKATSLHKRSMEAVIKYLDTTPITVHYANGDLQKTYVCKVMSSYKEANGPTFYELHLNPAYSENVARNFGELHQDAMRRLAACTKKLTAPPMRLLLRLSLQGKGKPFTRTLEELLEEIGMDVNTYRANSTRVEGQIIELCDTMVRAGAAESYTPTYTTSARGRKQLRKVTFYPVKDRDGETSKSGNIC